MRTLDDVEVADRRVLVRVDLNVTIVGGGDSVAALEAFRLTERVDHVSTGGGASLALVEREPLPGVQPLG